jgi:hypothetical protein
VLTITQEADELKPSSAGSSIVPGKEDGLCRGSIVSNASRLSSRSSTFFPNSSRSPRNLTNLASRVHSPDRDQLQKEASLRQAQNRIEGPATVTCGVISHGPSAFLQSWELPSLKFRPFSLSSSVQCPSDRPRTSAGVQARSCTAELISPTPERPMSSQSRKRFSKILDIDDDYPDPDARPMKRSFNSMNFLSLKKVDEIPETSYPARFSIPPFSPLKTVSTSDGNGFNNIAAFSTPVVTSSQANNPEQSTVESLLDRHIEALGLMPEMDGDDSESAQDVGARFPSGATDDTFKAVVASLGKKNITRSYSLATAPSHFRSSLGSPERRRLMPRRLFASVDMSSSRLPSLQSAPQFAGLVPGNIGFRGPSYGWQTLASSSQLNSVPSISRYFPHVATEGSRDADILRFKLRRRSALSLSPTSPSRWSQSVEDLSRWNDEIHIHRRPREDLNRQVSHRRRQRIRMKLKRNSQSLASITAKGVAERMGNGQAPPNQGQNSGRNEDTHFEVHGPVELDSKPVESCREDSTSPKIPHRWSSLINVLQQPVKKSIDVARKPSVRTMRSHPSISSLAEPINSTRFAAQGPHVVSQISISMLAPPDLGPPVHASTFDLNIPYAPEPSTVRPTLRETQSFFSDESSRLNNKPGTFGGTGTLRKKIGLHSLRNVIPVSPGASMVQRAFSAKQTGNRLHIHHSCNNIAGGKKSFDESAPLDGTVGMSDFAYRKRRMVQRVKDWWMRQCVQKKLVGTLRRRKAAG